MQKSRFSFIQLVAAFRLATGSFLDFCQEEDELAAMIMVCLR